MTDSPIDEVRVMMEAMLDHQINGRTSRFYEKYLQVFAALPLIRAAVLEEAAKVAEDTARAQDGNNDYYAGARRGCFMAADAIRALKEQP